MLEKLYTESSKTALLGIVLSFLLYEKIAKLDTAVFLFPNRVCMNIK